ncbi:UvrD-helicase domain-containing protein [Nesterenkonia flava]|uniref:AAA family ATPase n=1 Tax=Nesterenkonia flava TaxID=469799 RepID=A0ABU1FX21_9MICC|nr:UvrD-helicase domain-containing protein [Nesterenkonia flava]MDR5712706.1 AAA family ATPase [Nesterenkonia flava]
MSDTDTSTPAAETAKTAEASKESAAKDIPVPSLGAGIEEEREYVRALYHRLDELREEKEAQLTQVRSSGAVGTMQNVSERDAFATLYEDRLAQLNAVDDRLVFGRLDLDTEETRYIGRIGLTTESRQRLMIDWRAPEAGVFYQATAFDRQGVRRRRHLLLKRREVQGLEDEVLDAALLQETQENHGDGALLAALTARRTGQMGDIVATIQAEQDRIIRADRSGVLVVQGGPGTGKTAVALHRAAYLLYAHRERLKSAGVLIVGPNATFMSYVERVLPSLGETGVVMSSLADLYPGVRGVEESDPRVAEIKGRLIWREIIADAVAHRKRSIAGPRTVMVEGAEVTVTPKMIKRGLERARATGKPYNEARATFVKVVVKEIAEKLERQLQKSSAGNDADRSYLVEDVRTSRDVRVLLNLCWLPRTPQNLLEDLFSKPGYLADVAPSLSEQERALLRREPGSPFTLADVPLLDEAAELLGDLDETAGREEARQKAMREKDLENAKKAVENATAQLEEMGIEGFLNADDVVALNTESGPALTAAERAGVDRTWTYGHIVVDEAQELSPMQWHVLFRRCPLKSFTAVGDIAQGSSPSAAASWQEALEPFAADRLRIEELTVNYRTPRIIVDLAERVAAANGLDTTSLRTVREGEHEPVIEQVEESELVTATTEAVTAEQKRLGEGLVAAIVPERLIGAVREDLIATFGKRVGRGAGSMTQDVVALTAEEAKGLEFDAVVLTEPAELLDEARGRIGSLYVALTRPTHALRVVASRELPAGFR